jgi:hypothetical protein
MLRFCEPYQSYDTCYCHHTHTILTSDWTNTWGWGSVSENILKIGAFGSTARGTLFKAWLSNMPQVLLSFHYLNLNTLCTFIACAQEWNTLGSTRKGL